MSLFYSARSGARLAWLLGVVLAVGQALVPAMPASACGTAGSSAAGYTYSSQLTATQLVVCNSSPGLAAQPIVVAPVAKTSVTKVAVVSCSTVTSRVYFGAPSYASKLVKTTSCSTGWISMVAVLPPAPSSPTAGKISTGTGTSTTAGSSATTPGVAPQSAQQAFTPDAIAINAGVLSLQAGQGLALSTTALTHYRTGVLLGQSVIVQFVPVQISWQFGDGQSLSASMGEAGQTWHSFGQSGAKQVSAAVSFVASYRFAGQQAWATEAGLLVREATLTISVAAAPLPPQAVGRVRLVATDCLVNPRGRGCP